MNMSMDKPIALNSIEGIKVPREEYKNAVPKARELEYENVHGQTDSAE